MLGLQALYILPILINSLPATVAWKLSTITISLENGISSKCITGVCPFQKL